MPTVALPIQYFGDTVLPRPAANARIFVGRPDFDPAVAGNQIEVTARQENGSLVRVPQPIRTNAGGYPTLNGSVIQPTVEGNFSIRVLSENGSQLFYTPNSAQALFNSVDSASGVIAAQSSSTAAAIQAALIGVTGYRSHKFRENTANTPETIDGILLSPHSNWVAVEGGSDADVAAALSNAKSSGSGWNGAVSVVYPDPVSGQSHPVRFDRPAAVTAYIRVSFNAAAAASDVGQLSGIILRFFESVTVGQEITTAAISDAILDDLPLFPLVRISTSTTGGNYLQQNIPIAINQIATITGDRIRTERLS